jgi:hypothetical protein
MECDKLGIDRSICSGKKRPGKARQQESASKKVGLVFYLQKGSEQFPERMAPEIVVLSAQVIPGLEFSG